VRPLVKVSENDTRAPERRVGDDALADKLARLMTTLEKGRAQMNVEDMN
jgi:hypothetical protein